MFAGTVGIYTGMKAGAFSVSENQRYPEEHPIYFLENMIMLFGGVDQISWLIRKTLENCEDYECAFNHFSTKTINSLGYITIAGIKEDQGAVISRNRFNTAHIDQLDSKNGKWYVVQANNDQWVDGGCFNRCSSAKENLDKNGQEIMDINVLR
jgi:acid ceramidase